MKFAISFFILLLIFGGQAWADCKSDCQNDYQSEINSCKDQFSDPDDADDLATCMDDAKTEYESCLEECETEASDVAMVSSFQGWLPRRNVGKADLQLKKDGSPCQTSGDLS